MQFWGLIQCNQTYDIGIFPIILNLKFIYSIFTKCELAVVVKPPIYTNMLCDCEIFPIVLYIFFLGKIVQSVM